jgi:hypothetical protein
MKPSRFANWTLLKNWVYTSYPSNTSERSGMTENRRYRGVECLHCKQPIQISLRIARNEVEQENTTAQHEKCQVFHLRCPACGKERPYKISEIQEFESAGVIPSAGPSSMSAHFGSTSKAANG